MRRSSLVLVVLAAGCGDRGGISVPAGGDAGAIPDGAIIADTARMSDVAPAPDERLDDAALPDQPAQDGGSAPGPDVGANMTVGP